MLTAVAVLGATLALCLLAVQPTWGIMTLMVVRPLVDTQWATTVLAGRKLTEIVSVLVPVIVLTHLLFSSDRRSGLGRMPLRLPWTLWVASVALFSMIIAATSGTIDGLDVFFRHLNGFVG